VTFSGSYNVSPAISPDGRHLTYISREDGRFRVCCMNWPRPDARADRHRTRRVAQLRAEWARPCCMPRCRAGAGYSARELDGKTRARLSESGVDAREAGLGA